MVENPLQKHAHLPYPKIICEEVKPFGRYDVFLGRFCPELAFCKFCS
jgi:hypothetical protein